MDSENKALNVDDLEKVSGGMILASDVKRKEEIKKGKDPKRPFVNKSKKQPENENMVLYSGGNDLA